jgi:hypothetical protein
MKDKVGHEDEAFLECLMVHSYIWLWSVRGLIIGLVGQVGMART